MYNVVGKPVTRIDSKEIVTGKKQYMNDLYFPRMLYARGTMSTEHHAKILGIDTSEAEKVPGVKGIITGKDIPHNLYGPDFPDQPILPTDKVRYKGEMVVAIAAETDEAAQEAARLVKVKYEPLPAYFNPFESIKEGAAVIHEEGQGVYAKGNYMLPVPNMQHLATTTIVGDVNKAFAEADAIAEGRFTTCPQKNAPIENHGAVAMYHSKEYEIYTNMSMPFFSLPHTAAALKTSNNNVRQRTVGVGGGFGGKNELTVEVMVALLAKKTGRPVKWVLSDEEEFMFCSAKHPYFIDIKFGAKKDGTLTAGEVDILVDGGAYRTWTSWLAHKNNFLGCGPYNVPNLKLETRMAYTNKQAFGAFRGFGMSQITFAHESIMNMLAEKLGMDPIELRLKNCYVDGDRLPVGQSLRAVGVKQALEIMQDKLKGEAAQA
jgi:CO/xanthine dehydrogenase Mo-binding subunit